MARQTPYESGSTAVTRGNPVLVEDRPTRYDSLRHAIEAARLNLAHELDEDPDRYGFASDAEQEFGVTLLPPEWKSTPDETLWNKRKKARARRVAVARYYLMGKPVSEIARILKVSDYTAYMDLVAIEEEWRQSAIADIEILAARDLARLDAVINNLWPAVEKRDAKAANAVIEAIKERGTILGYRSGVQIDIEQYVRQVAEANGYDPDRAVQVAQRISVNFKT